MVESMTVEKEFWLKRMSNDIVISNIRLDFNRPHEYINKNEIFNMALDEEVIKKLNKLTNNDNFLLYTVLISVLNICLYRYTESLKIVVGSPLLKIGENSAIDNEALPIVNDINPENTFRELLLSVRTNLLETYKNQNYPLSNIFDEIGIEIRENKCSLFDVGIQLSNIHMDFNDVINDITLKFTREEENIFGQVIFNSNLFRLDTIEQLLRTFNYILKIALNDSSIAIKDFINHTEDEKRKLFEEWNNTKTDYPKDFCVHQLFEAQVEKNPDATALCFGNNKLTYKELNEKSNQLAHFLKENGIDKDILVGLFIDRSLEMIIGLLGILKAGGTYVPIDPTYPKDRIASMLESVEFPVLLTRKCLLEKLPENKSKVISLDKDWPSIATGNTENLKDVVSVRNTAYVIFTSGSTGMPKAAAVYHQGWTNLLNWFSSQYNINNTDKALIISSFSFDITQRSIAMPLINGGELHLLASDYYDVDLITKTISKNNITLLNCSPSTFYPLVESKDDEEYKKLKSLRCLFLGGEAISPSRLAKWAKSDLCNAVISNVYGAAECSDVSSFYDLKDFDRYMKSSVPIGIPIFNTKIYILDENLNPVLPGVVGEICLTGDGVGKGYINDPELTKQKFVKNPFSDITGSMLYRTGDLGRFLPDGCLEFNGRVDYQIKIRGLRIELGDIESVIRQYQEVNEAVVVDKLFKQGDQRLIAYITLKQSAEFEKSKNLFIDKLRQFTREKLPAYMIPNFFVILDKLPISPNGKIDRKALKQMDVDESSLNEKEDDGCTSPMEREIMTIFTNVLKVNKLGINENIFDKGAHSLMVTQIVATINNNYELNLAPTDVYIQPTVAGLAKRISMIKI